MADVTGPNLLVVGGDTKRLQWLTHHVTSHWPNAQVTTLPAGEPAAVNRLISERTPDAVILQADFADESAAAMALHDMGQMLQVQPALQKFYFSSLLFSLLSPYFLGENHNGIK